MTNKKKIINVEQEFEQKELIDLVPDMLTYALSTVAREHAKTLIRTVKFLLQNKDTQKFRFWRNAKGEPIVHLMDENSSLKRNVALAPKGFESHKIQRLFDTHLIGGTDIENSEDTWIRSLLDWTISIPPAEDSAHQSLEKLQIFEKDQTLLQNMGIHPFEILNIKT